MALTRRIFLKTATLSAAGSFSGLGPAIAFEHILPTDVTSREPLQEMPYGAVQLTSGPFAEHYASMQAHYLSLSNDRLLKVYRQRAGLPAPGDDMGGWYDLDGFVPGHSLGQYISGLARFGAGLPGSPCTEKARTLVAGFAETLGPKNQSILRPDTNLWICYTLDKHLAGLIDAGTLAQDRSAAELLNRVLDGAAHLLPERVHDRIGKKDPPYDEPFVLPENLFLAAHLTGNPRFTELATRYLLDRDLFDPLARGADPFPGQHAYSHAMALSSAGRAFLTLGDPKYRDAMARAFTLLTTTQQFASGGWGPNETFITPHRGELFSSLSSTVDHFETPCGSYAATKLARYLLRTAVPASSVHADNLERVLFNTILTVKRPDSDGDYPYYSTYSSGARKVFYPKKWPCCSGTLVQTVADYPLDLYFKSADGIYAALYMPSTVGFGHEGAEFQIRQETLFPATDTVNLALTSDRPAAFTLYLRLPEWLSRPATISINGKREAIRSASGTFVAVRRTWRSGDRLELILPQDFRVEPIDDLHPDTVALMRGPVQYVAIEGSRDMRERRRILPGDLQRVGPEVFVERHAENQTTFVPLRAIVNETYTSYFSKA